MIRHLEGQQTTSRLTVGAWKCSRELSYGARPDNADCARGMEATAILPGRNEPFTFAALRGSMSGTLQAVSLTRQVLVPARRMRAFARLARVVRGLCETKGRTMLDTIIAPESLDPSLRSALRTSLLHSGALLLQALHVASTAVVHAPTLDDRAGTLERARELLLQLEYAAALYRDLSDADLLQHAQRMLPNVNLPGSWLEVASAQLVLALAAHAALEHQLPLAGVPSEGARFALACLTEHCHAARAALDELDVSSPSQRAALRGSLDRWLSVISGVFGESELRSNCLHEFDRVTRDLGLAH